MTHRGILYCRFKNIMLDGTRNLLGDIASGKIKDERILLLADELRANDRKLSEATSEKEVLQAENAKLESQIIELESTITNLQERLRNAHLTTDELDPKANEILKIFFEATQPITAERIAQSVGLSVNEAKYHMDELGKRKFFQQAGAEPQMYRMGDRQTFLSTFQITSAGRKFYIEHVKENQ
jgi:predicted transcriptional regulator